MFEVKVVKLNGSNGYIGSFVPIMLLVEPKSHWMRLEQSLRGGARAELGLAHKNELFVQIVPQGQSMPSNTKPDAKSTLKPILKPAPKHVVKLR